MLQVDVKNHAVMRLKLISESEVGTMDSFTAFLWFLAAISSIRCQNAPTETTAAHFLHLVAASTDGNAAEPETVLAAGEAISSLGNLSVLDGYVLQNRTVFISGCNVQETTDLLEAQLVGGGVLAVIAGGCSSVAEAVARVSRERRVLHISYSPSLPEILEGTAVGIYPSRESFFRGVASVLEFYDWRRVAVFSETPASNLPELVLSATRSLSVYSDVTALQEVLDEDIRVLVLDTYPQKARRLLCQAARGDDVHYPEYVWIIPAWYGERWWDESLDPEPDSTIPRCSSEEIERVLERSLAVGAEPPTLGQEVEPIGSLGQAEFRQLYPDPLAGYAYDAVWSLALTLATSTANSSLRDVANSDEGVVQLQQWLRNVSFNGVTGVVSFGEAGARTADRAVVLQYRTTENNELVREEIGMTSPLGAQFQYNTGENDSTVWPDGVPPQVEVINPIAIPLTVIYAILTTLGIIYSIVCIIFNFAYRKRTVVHLSSPNLNYLICAGAIVLLFSVYFTIWPTTDPDGFEFLCGAIVWTGAIGASLQYGTIQAKMFRVYLIFRKPHQAGKKILRDWQLMLYVLALVTIDVVLLTTVTTLPDVRSSARLVDDRENPPTTDDNGVTTVALIFDCQSRRDGADLYWLLPLFGYKFILQIIATVLAILLCVLKVDVKPLDDSRQIQAITYFNMGVLVVSGGLAFGVSNYKNAKAAVNGLSLLVSATFNLSMVFVPQMVHLYKDPKGKRVFKRRGTTIQELEAAYSDQRKTADTRVKISPDTTTTGNSSNTSTTVASNVSRNSTTHSTHSQESRQRSSAESGVVQIANEGNETGSSTSTSTTLPSDVSSNSTTNGTHIQESRQRSSSESGVVEIANEGNETKIKNESVEVVNGTSEDENTELNHEPIIPPMNSESIAVKEL